MTQRERQVLDCIAEDPMISQQELAEKLGISRSAVAVHISNLMKKGHIAGKGYVLRSGSYAVVVGGANMDIGGQSFSPLIPMDSNPGAVRMSPGGVGRNIAHDLRLLGADVRLLTAFGEDLYGRQLASICTELGIDLTGALWVADKATSTYLYIADHAGDMALAVSDMEICKEISPTYLARNLPLLSQAQVVVTDTNLPQESLKYLAEHCTAPLFCDPVSTVKAEKLRPILPRIHTLKPNRLEAELLSGVTITTMDDVPRAADRLLELGVQRLFISLGADGVYAATPEQHLHLGNPPCTIISTTGCGDAFMAALVWAYLEGLDLHDTALAGLSAAGITMEHHKTINPALSADALRSRMGRVGWPRESQSPTDLNYEIYER